MMATAAHPAATPQEAAALARLERDLAAGRELRRWWQSRSDPLARTFPIEQANDRSNSSYGFFDEVQMGHERIRVMGVVQEMFYDHPKTLSNTDVVEWTCRQLREFVLKYFARISDFRDPQIRACAEGTTPPEKPGVLSWCPVGGVDRKGFGFSQHFVKRRNGTLAPISDSKRYAIADLRDIVRDDQWRLAKVKIYDFSVRFHPFDPPVPDVGITLDEKSWLAIAPDFIIEADRPVPGVRAEFGIGYAYVKNPPGSLLGYGPGEFDAAWKEIRFRLLDSGEIRVHMVFVSNRPKGVVQIRLNPFAVALRGLDAMSFGMGSRLFKNVARAIRETPAVPPAFDPVYSYVALVNDLTNGRAARDWCVSREQLDIAFLVLHFRNHQKALSGSLVTWRQIPDWLDEERIPEWVRTGVSS